MRITELDASAGTGSVRGWLCAGDESAYLLADDGDRVAQCYWGPPIDEHEAVRLLTDPVDAAHDVYLTWGGLVPCEPALHVDYGDGQRFPAWRTSSCAVRDAGSHLVCTLEDAPHGLSVELHVRVHPSMDVVERWSVLRNAGAAPVRVDRVFSATFVAPRWASYRRSHAFGRWSSEGRLERHELPHGIVTDRSLEGTRSLGPNPWLMLDDGGATEETGAVCGVALAWSGSFALSAERTAGGVVRMTGGIDDTDLVLDLEPGEDFATPILAGMWTSGGFGAASRTWHGYTRGWVLPRATSRPVLYNSWEATGFDVDESSQLRLADLASAMGCELFVMDDGWFGARDSDRAGLGDWQPSTRKFPRGLAPVIEGVRARGMRFGIWVEPEMVNPDSDLFRSRPDWVVRCSDLPATQMRNQLVLNFGRADVRSWAYDWLDRLLGEHDITFVKWDCNRGMSEPGWPERANPERLWVEHVRGVYDVLDRLRVAHPGVEFEACASGGGRVDHGMLARCEQFWTSDNTDAVDRLSLQEGCSQVYPAQAMGAWVTDVPNYLTKRTEPLGYRFVVAMAGVLAVGADLASWTDDERTDAARWVALYKRVRDTVQGGDLYRLASLDADGFSAVQYLGADGEQSVLLIAGLGGGMHARERRVVPQGIDLEATYRVETHDGAGDGTCSHTVERSGAALRGEGLAVPAGGNYPSAAVILTKIRS
ncbi:MAG: alpha-galactosidase [Streptosporangiales bacterium]